MRWHLPRTVRGRAITGVVALYALLLQVFLGYAAPARALAGLLCLPFLITLSVTGSFYLFKDESSGSLFAYRTRVKARATPGLGSDRLIFNAVRAVPEGVPVSCIDPATPETAALVTLAKGEARINVYLDPYTGDVLDRVARDAEFMVVVRGLHGLAYLGPFANALIEVVAGFAIILVVTGTYLWWPRGRSGGMVSLRGTPRRPGVVARPVRRHRPPGGAGLFFLALTGLPWSIWWGQQLRGWANAAGLAQPTALRARRPASTVPLRDLLPDPGWTLEDAPVARSGPAPRAAGSLGIDQAAAILARLGMPPATRSPCRWEPTGSTPPPPTPTTPPASG